MLKPFGTIHSSTTEPRIVFHTKTHPFFGSSLCHLNLIQYPDITFNWFTNMWYIIISQYSYNIIGKSHLYTQIYYKSIIDITNWFTQFNMLMSINDPFFTTIHNGIPYRMVPPSYKLVKTPHSLVRYIYHKP